LREAVQARLLEPIHAGESYRFRHALLQEAIYEDALPGERRRLHAAVAHALSEDPDRPPEDGDLAPRLARHWYEAREFDRAFRASHAAATAAEHQSAYAEALTHYERMLDLWDRVAAASRGFTSARLRERLAWTAFLTGDLASSAQHGRLALAELAKAPDVSLQIRVLDQLAWTLSRLGEDPEEASRQMATLDPEGRPAAERVLILVHRVATLREEGRYTEALDVARSLMDLPRSEKDPALEVRTSMVLAGVLYNFDIDEALRILGPALELVAQAGDDVLEADVNQEMCEILLEGQRHEELLTMAPAAAEFAGRAGLGRWARPQLRFYQAWAHLGVGQVTQCLDVIRLALLDEPTGRARALLHIVAAQASTVAGAFDDAAAHLEASRLPGASEEGELGRGWLATAKAELALAEGRFEDVQQIVQDTAPRVLDNDVYTPMSDTIWWLAEVGLAVAAERAERARAARDDTAMNDVRTLVASLTGYVDQARLQRDQAGIPDSGKHAADEALIAGHLARIEGRDDPALWVAAAEAFLPRSHRGLAARYRQAEAMLAAKAPRDEIAAVMADAHATSVEIGARPLVSRFEALARRARIELRPAVAAAVSADEPAAGAPEEAPAPGSEALRARGLSDREIEVLTLVAAGFSNHDIGTRLFISDKTASVHVSHILDKLDVSTRTEAATIGVRLGLPDVERDDGARPQ
jgi:DNA-binding NarL/FixJ family response regulator